MKPTDANQWLTVRQLSQLLSTMPPDLPVVYDVTDHSSFGCYKVRSAGAVKARANPDRKRFQILGDYDADYVVDDKHYVDGVDPAEEPRPSPDIEYDYDHVVRLSHREDFDANLDLEKIDEQLQGEEFLSRRLWKAEDMVRRMEVRLHRVESLLLELVRFPPDGLWSATSGPAE